MCPHTGLSSSSFFPPWLLISALIWKVKRDGAAQWSNCFFSTSTGCCSSKLACSFTRSFNVRCGEHVAPLIRSSIGGVSTRGRRTICHSSPERVCLRAASSFTQPSIWFHMNKLIQSQVAPKHPSLIGWSLFVNIPDACGSCFCHLRHNVPAVNIKCPANLCCLFHSFSRWDKQRASAALCVT